MRRPDCLYCVLLVHPPADQVPPAVLGKSGEALTAGDKPHPAPETSFTEVVEELLYQRVSVIGDNRAFLLDKI